MTILHTGRKHIGASRRNVINLKRKGGSVEVKRPDQYNETATPVNGIVGLASQPMANNVGKQFKPSGVTGPISITGNYESLLGSGLKHISFADSKKKPKKAKLRL